MHATTVRGVEVPSLGFGTWMLEGDTCRTGVEHALSTGYRHIDTAQMYENEDHVGAALAASDVAREEIFLTTKVSNDNHEPDDVRSSAEESLRKLGTDYVDLLLIHWPMTDEVPIARTMDAMRALSEEGKARNIGVSNFTPSLLREAMEHGEVFCNQVEYHPYLHQPALAEMAVEHDFLLTAYSPLARGKALSDDVLNEIAEGHGVGPAEIAVRWLLRQDHVAAIPKSETPEHIESNFQALEIELTDDEVERIDNLDRGMRIIDPDFAPAWER